MRARSPDRSGFAERDGVRLGYEVFGDGDTTILLLPTWTIIHSRFWKMQVHHLARRHRVITYDGPGNGRSDRSTDPARYAPDSYARDALAVLRECGATEVVAVGMSLGSAYGIRLARQAPQVVSGLVMIGPSISLAPPSPARAATMKNFTKPYREEATGWGKYNLDYWHREYTDFTEFFFAQCFVEPHSTKPIEDSVKWAGQTDADVLEAESNAPGPQEDWATAVAALECPVLVIHGTNDRISPFQNGVEAARLSGGALLTLDGSGHIPNVRDPVLVNRAIDRFIGALP